jgi:hypothetical protein
VAHWWLFGDFCTTENHTISAEQFGQFEFFRLTLLFLDARLAHISLRSARPSSHWPREAVSPTIGSDEQIFGGDEQVRGRHLSD